MGTSEMMDDSEKRGQLIRHLRKPERWRMKVKTDTIKRCTGEVCELIDNLAKACATQREKILGRQKLLDV
jgi:hypothetical protein